MSSSRPCLLRPSSQTPFLRAARHARAALSRASRRAVMTAAVALGGAFLMSAAVPAAAPRRRPSRRPISSPSTPPARKHKLSISPASSWCSNGPTPAAPSSRKHYGSGNMPATQKAATAQGVVWLAINSDRARPTATTSSRTALDGLDEGAIGRAHRRADGRRRPDRPASTAPAPRRTSHHRPQGHAGLCRRHRQHRIGARVDDIKTATNRRWAKARFGRGAFGGRCRSRPPRTRGRTAAIDRHKTLEARRADSH